VSVHVIGTVKHAIVDHNGVLARMGLGAARRGA
jgi:hypothetical protein